MQFKTLSKFKTTHILKKELKLKCPTASPVLGTSVKLVRFKSCFIEVYCKTGLKKTTKQQKKTKKKQQMNLV